MAPRSYAYRRRSISNDWSMEDWVVAAISAASGIVGAGVGGAATYLSQRAAGNAQERGELSAALIQYGYALDALNIEIQRLPRRTRLARLGERAINSDRMPNLNRLIEWVFTKTIGRDGQRAIDRLIATTNRLVMVAPKTLLDPIERISSLLGRVEERDQSWDRDWAAARADVLTAARAHLRL